VLAALTFYADLIVGTVKLKLKLMGMIIVKGRNCLRNADKQYASYPPKTASSPIFPGLERSVSPTIPRKCFNIYVLYFKAIDDARCIFNGQSSPCDSNTILDMRKINAHCIQPHYSKAVFSGK
jgi:hypothetical protein